MGACPRPARCSKADARVVARSLLRSRLSHARPAPESGSPVRRQAPPHSVTAPVFNSPTCLPMDRKASEASPRARALCCGNRGFTTILLPRMTRSWGARRCPFVSRVSRAGPTFAGRRARRLPFRQRDAKPVSDSNPGQQESYPPAEAGTLPLHSENDAGTADGGAGKKIRKCFCRGISFLPGFAVSAAMVLPRFARTLQDEQA